ncbi:MULTISPECIES: class I adenylate-forming enzyme family protein [unclassified Paraburkholderia]|uniref:class I adenylate-forming enzyme family protein n=1 Tax=unclassified Paraburkholderia TaxID=2615204 RepID=UPI0015E5B419|nr:MULTISPECIES: class I adenylate-forming enzyme family protein [unclassified Paraburkholderia]
MKALVSDCIRQAAQLHPDKTAIVADGRRISYSELDQRAQSLACKLVWMGVKRGERVAIVSENSIEYFIVMFAVWRAAGVLATIFPTFGATELTYAFRNATPRLILVEQERLAAVQSALLETGLNFEVRVIGPDQLLEDVEPVNVALPMAMLGDPGIISYTSGTSGRPKPVTHTHGSLALGPQIYASIWHMTEHDVFFVPMPLAWLAGVVTTSLVALSVGATVALARRFKDADALRVLVEERVTFFFGVTTMYVKLLQYIKTLPVAPELLLRCCIAGGEPRNEPAFEEWQRVAGAAVLDCYASAECFPVATYDPSIDPIPRLGSGGRLLDGVQLRLLRPDGTEAAAGEVGEAQVRSPVMMHGYWGEPDLTEAAFTDDGWYRLGDYLRIDEDGYVFVVGRASDMIIRGGANVSPAEVESVLVRFAGVAEAAVVGLPDAVFGQSVAAAIVPAVGAQVDLNALKIYCSSELAHYKVPALVVLFGTLPRNNAGKVVRRHVIPMIEELREKGTL